MNIRSRLIFLLPKPWTNRLFINIKKNSNKLFFSTFNNNNKTLLKQANIIDIKDSFKDYKHIIENESNRLFNSKSSSSFLLENNNKKPIGYLSSSIGVNSIFGIGFLIVIVCAYIWSENHFDKIENNYLLIQNKCKQLLESNEKLNQLFNEINESNKLIIKQNNSQISVQEIRSILSVIFTFVSLVLFIIKLKKDYLQ